MTDILLVDDDKTHRVQIGGYLNRLQLPFQIAVNGKEAVELIEKYHPRLILLDVVMPEMDGFEVLQTVRSQEQFSNVYIIMLTSLSQRNNIVKAIKMGADDYLTKPVDFDTLSQKVSQFFVRIGKKAMIHDKE